MFAGYIPVDIVHLVILLVLNVGNGGMTQSTAINWLLTVIHNHPIPPYIPIMSYTLLPYVQHK